MEDNDVMTNSAANEADAFLEGFGGEADCQDDETLTTDEGITQTSAASLSAEDNETSDTAEESETATTPDTQTKENPAVAHAEEHTVPEWEINLLGEKRRVSVNEVTADLLQKGYDYERIRTKYDEAKPVIALFTKYAKEAGMTVPEYLTHIRTEAKMTEGMTEEEAKRIVELEDRENAIKAKEEAENAAKSEEDSRKAKIDADLAEFAKAFPDVFKNAKEDTNAIPQSVWDDVNNGMSLVSAYSKYAVAEAKKKVAEAEKARDISEQNAKNARASTGSLKGAGNNSKQTDSFLLGFEG